MIKNSEMRLGRNIAREDSPTSSPGANGSRWACSPTTGSHGSSGSFVPYIELPLEPPEVDFSTIDKIEGIEFLIDVLSSPLR